jgi:hypothetical protein
MSMRGDEEMTFTALGEAVKESLLRQGLYSSRKIFLCSDQI